VIQDLNDGSIDASSTMPHFANDVYGPNFANTTMSHFNMFGSSSTVGAPYIQGGYTNLLLGVDRSAAFQPAIKKLNFDGVPNQDDAVPNQESM
jgi:hypothetical protein